MLGRLQPTAASSSSSAAELQLRRGSFVDPVHETEGKRGRVSAGRMGKRLRVGGSEGEGCRGLAAVVVYLGHGELEETTGG